MYLSAVIPAHRLGLFLLLRLGMAALLCCLLLPGAQTWAGLAWVGLVAVVLAWSLGCLAWAALALAARRLDLLWQRVADGSPQATGAWPKDLIEAPVAGTAAWWRHEARAAGLGLLLGGLALAACAVTGGAGGPGAGSGPLAGLAVALLVSLVLVREGLGMEAWGGLGAYRPAIGALWQFSWAWRRWQREARGLRPDPDGQRSEAMLRWLAELRRGVQHWHAQAWPSAAPALRPGLRHRRRLAQDAAGPVTLATELAQLRLVVFATALSEEVLRPFLAVFALQVGHALAWPVGAFMLCLALSQLLGPAVSQRWRPMRAVALAALGGSGVMALSACSQSAGELVAWRAGGGLAYGLVLILVQTRIVQLTTPAQRARGLAQVAAAIVAAGICGPPLGGQVVAWGGAPAGFLACAACLTLAALLAWRADGRARASAAPVDLGRVGWRGVLAVMRHRQVLAITWLAAVPARLSAAALLVLIVPLYLQEHQVSAVVTGQVLLLYFLLFWLSAPWVAYHSDRTGQRLAWLVAGGLVSALACGLLVWVPGLAGAAGCCAGLGLGQAMQSSPQLARVTESFERDPRAVVALGATPAQALAAFRFVERAGSVAAPFVAAAMLASWGAAGSAGLLALGLAAVTVGLWVAAKGVQA